MKIINKEYYYSAKINGYQSFLNVYIIACTIIENYEEICEKIIKDMFPDSFQVDKNLADKILPMYRTVICLDNINITLLSIGVESLNSNDEEIFNCNNINVTNRTYKLKLNIS